MLAGGSGGAEHRHSAPDVGERVKAAGELAGDVANALGVRYPYLWGLVAEPQQQLLVEGQLMPSGALGLVCHGPSVES